MTAIKQAYEDYLRHRADKEVNNYPITIIRNGSVQVNPQIINVRTIKPETINLIILFILIPANPIQKNSSR